MEAKRSSIRATLLFVRDVAFGKDVVMTCSVTKYVTCAAERIRLLMRQASEADEYNGAAEFWKQDLIIRLNDMMTM